MPNIYYIDRVTKRNEKERVYGGFFIKSLYGEGLFARCFSWLFLPIIAHCAFLSRFYGAFQKSAFSKRLIRPFIDTFAVDASEFAEPVSSFPSFNDFFIRRLKPSCRPIAGGNDVVILPADARYLVYPDLSRVDGLLVKGRMFSLAALLQDEELAGGYAAGTLVMARLAPVDYHRYHFPCTCTPGAPRLINGALFSVNPLALKRNVHILTENKRMVTALQTKNFGTVLYIEVGATYVGSIRQTFVPGEPYAKGDEKGYFSFGGSCVILLFEPGAIQLDQDLIDASFRGLEMRGLMGQPLGRALRL
jgi:phosphatidylserine decarboxylase